MNMYAENELYFLHELKLKMHWNADYFNTDRI